MGDLRDWSHQSNGVTEEEEEDRAVNGGGVASSSSALSSIAVAQNTAAAVVIDAGVWELVEEATEEIISHVQPTVVSEKRRKDVIFYVRRLIGDYLGFEVFQFGSVPLCTYLPDGDIDLTAFGQLNFEDALANDVRSVLLREEQNTAAQFVVKDVQLITAEVKLVKCFVQNIVVDISFNQLGGLSTLCFLEQVNTLIGNRNLFKRSIILIKAWCYYESRILGAHHGLISTYALETLVLYIFNHFHSSLNGPLAVLYKFLEYFSKFDWDNYCISLNGPIHISSLPELVVDTLDNGGGDLLLSDEFLRDSMEMFAVPFRVSEAPSKTFPQKHLNIVDPLRENNNLGRSVSRGNFYRIMGAFNFGARKLRYVLSRPEESLADEVRKFFFNTLERHGKDPRPDVQDPVWLPIYNGFALESPPSLEIETCQVSGSVPELKSIYLMESFCNGVNNVLSLSKEMELNRSVNEPSTGSMRAIIPYPKLLEGESGANEASVSRCHISGDAKDLATPRILNLEISDQKSKSPVGQEYNAPHLYCSPPRAGEKEVGNETATNHEETDTTSYNHHDELMVSVNGDLNSVPVDESEIDSNHRYQEIVHEDQDSLQSLGGDYRNHLYNLQYGRWLYDYVLCAPVPHRPRPVIPRYATKEPWETKRRSPGFSHDMISHINCNGIIRQPVFYPHMNQLMIPDAPFGMEEKPKPRGTGTYFPNKNHYRDRPSNHRWRNQAPIRSPRSNGHASIPHQEMNSFDRSSYYEPSQYQVPHLQNGGNPRSSNSPPFGSPGRKAYPNSNGLIPPAERCVEVGSFVDQLPLDSSIKPGHEQSTVLNSIPFKPALWDVAQSNHQNEMETSLQLPQLQEPELDKVVEPYRLKDEDDFPPLSA